MPVTVSKELYTFAELLELEKKKKVRSNIVEKVRSKLSDRVTSGEWFDYVYEMWKSALGQIGFNDAEINFTGFWSQGDGASFTAKNIDLELLIRFMGRKWRPCSRIGSVVGGKKGEEEFRPWMVKKLRGNKAHLPQYRALLPHVDCFSAEVIRDTSNYYHENTCSFRVEETSGFPENLNDLLNQFEKDAEELRLRLSIAIYQSLDSEFEDLTTDEQLCEESDQNEVLFDISGHHEIP